MKLIKSEKGAALSLISAMMIIFIALVCLVIEGGRAYVYSHELQKILDAGTLAATTKGKATTNSNGEVYAYIELPEGENVAKRVVNENFASQLQQHTRDGKIHVKYNGGIGDKGRIEYSNGKIHIVGTIYFDTIFLKFFGIDFIEITRDSWATVQPKITY